MSFADSTTIEEMIARRKALWVGDAKEDARLVEQIAKTILRSPSLRRQIQADPALLIEAVMQIVDKQQRVVPFFFNEVQADFVCRWKGRSNRPFFVLKGRQQGFTTLITALQLCYCLVRKNFAGFTLADTAENMNAIFADKAKAMYERLPAVLKPHAKYNSRKELVFDRLGTSWRVGTAGENLGRSRTLHFVHYSEVAFYRCPLAGLQRSLGEAVTQDAAVVYETTANGWNSAKDLWDSGVCVNLFYPWWRTAEYRSRRYEALQTQDDWLQARLAWLADKGLDREQLAWYADKYAHYLDKQSIRQEYPCTPEEAWVSTAECEFDRDKVLDALSKIDPSQDKVGYFDCRLLHTAFGDEVQVAGWVDDPAGCIRLHSPPKTRTEGGKVWMHPYALGGDTAGEGSDWYSAKVVSGITGESVATLHVCHTDDDLYAMQVYALGCYYNHAVVAVEVNFSLMPTRLLERWGYSPLYRREKWDSVIGQVSHRVGFCTNAQTRPVILANLKSIWRASSAIEKDRDTLLEMLSFVKNLAGRPEAARGKHDDLVMALAIAHHALEQSSREWTEAQDEAPDWIHAHFHL